MADDSKFTGGCFCGAVEVETTGDPVAMGYCHCESCRHWSAGPVNGFTLWKRDAVRVTKGADLLGGYSKNPQSLRQWCKVCGGHVMTDHAPWGITDVYAAVLRDFPFKGALHVNYGEAVVRVHDGLPKFKDMPADMGGSGETIPE